MSIQSDNDKNVTSFQGGRMKNYYEFWKTITYDKEVLTIVRGMQIPIQELPLNQKIPHQIPFNKKETEMIDIEIQKMLNKEIIIPVSNKPQKGEFISTIFSRPKKTGGVKNYPQS